MSLSDLADGSPERPLRVLHCIPSMGGGGAERQLTYLARGLCERAVDVHVALVSGGPNLPRLQDAGATVHELGDGVRNSHDPRVLWRLARLVRRLRPDIVQAWLLQMEVLVSVAAGPHGTPWVLTERSSELAYRPSVKTRLRVANASRATAIVSNSAAGDDYWRARVPPRVRRVVIPNALPLHEIVSVDPLPHVDHGPTADRPLILFAGRFAVEKNVETLVNALARVLDRVDARAMLLGEGPLRTQIADLVVRRSIANRVHLAGYVPNLWAWMKRAAVFVSLSQFEGNPNTVLEAMACGCPVVLSDIPAHREIADLGAARLVAPQAPDEVAEAIVSILADPHAADRARAARVNLATRTTSAMAGAYARLYGDLVALHAKSG